MTDKDEKAKEALDEGRRAIIHQASSLDELRGRTGVLLAASSVSAAVLGSSLSTENGGEFGVAAVAAAAAFLTSVILCMWVLWPRKNSWIFTSNATILVEDWVNEDSRELAEMRSFVATRLHEYLVGNQKAIDRLMDLFQVAAMATGVQVILGVLRLTVG